MNTFKSLIFVVLFLFAGVTSAATVSVVLGKTVGLDDGGYFAGIVTLDIDGVEYPAMLVKWGYGVSENPGWEIDDTPWEGVLYTQSETTTTNVLYSEEYSVASKFFLDGMFGYYGTPDPLWAASYGEMVWDVLNGGGLWVYADRQYPAPESGVTLHDVYNTDVVGLDPNADYSGFMEILQTPIRSNREFLVFKAGSVVPIPPSVWLFGSGLLGLVGVARRKTS